MMKMNNLLVVVLFTCSLSLCLAASTRINVWQTAQNTGDRITSKTALNFGNDFSAPSTLQVNTATKYQTILGFGGAFTEAAAYTYSTMNAEKRKQIVEAYWGASGIGYTVGRVHMNSCDFSIATYSCDDVEDDFQLTHFNITHDQKWLIPLIKDAIAASSQHINLFVTPWSPPAWMKGNGKMDGSSFPGLKQNANVFNSWALFYSKFISAYKAQGIDFWGLTVQNEPEYAANWEACVYNPEQMRDFVKGYLGPQIKKDHPNVNIMIFDHNKDHAVQWAKTIYGDAQAAQYVWGLAFHWYSGPQFEYLAQAHDVAPTKHLLATEACNCPPARGDWGRGESYGYDIIGDLNNWAEGWTDWNLVLNPQGGPNHLNNFCDAPIIADASKQEVSFNIPYYYMGHFSKFILPKSVRVGSSCPSGVECTAFLRPDNNIAVVAFNRGNNPMSFKLKQNNMASNVTIPAHSIATFVYENF